MNGGRFDFDDGGTYCGGWEDGKAHGHGVCTGPKGQGEYAGAWHYGFEVSGIYVWPSGNTYGGQWQNGKRHGLGVEQRGRWLYRGEWTQGYKGRYGIRQSTNSHARYEGTWSSGLQDGYGTETYADGGTFQGQWLRGMRHGYGIRKSAAYGVAAKFRSRSHAHASLTSLRSEQGANDDDLQDKEKKSGEESRGGFVLRARSDPPQRRRRSLSERTLHMKQTLLSGLRIKKQKSTGDIHARVTTGSVRSSGSTMSCASDESGFGDGRHDDAVAPPEEHIEPNTVETYMGEWKNDKRSGFGISERSDGLKYEGEWFNNKKFGYGVTILKDGTREEGKYKNNVLVTSQRKKHLLFVRSSKLRERIDAATQAANRAAQIALQKADIAISRMATARDRAEQADYSYEQARADSDLARIHAKQFDPTFLQPGTEMMKRGLAGGQPRFDQMANHVGGHAHHDSHQQQVIRPAHMRLPHQESTASSLPPGAQYDSATALAGAASHEQMMTPFNTPPTDYKHAADAVGLVEYPMAADPQLQRQQWTPSPTGSPERALPTAETIQVPSVMMANDTKRQQSPERTAVVVHHDPHSPQPSTSKAADVAASQQQQQPMSQSTLSSPEKSVDKPQQQVGFRANVQTKHFTPSPADYGDNGGGGGGGDASAASSRTSLNLWNDHFDQYARIGNPAAGGGGGGGGKRFGAGGGGGGGGRTPSPSSNNPAVPSFGPLDSSPGGIPGGGAGSTAGGIIRRTTLSSTRDWMNLKAGKPPAAAADDSTTAPSTSTAAPSTPPSPPRPTANHTTTTTTAVAVRSPAKKSAGDPSVTAALNKKEEEKGSLPDVRQLNTYFTREDASKMSHQRRQEIIRLREEEELLQTNPLRYLFHPAVREWVIRWKLPLLVVLVNMCLSIVFYQLLTYSEQDDDDIDDDIGD